MTRSGRAPPCGSGGRSGGCCRLGLGVAEDLERGQAGDDVEEVVAEPLERAQLAVGRSRVVAPTSAMNSGISGMVKAMIAAEIQSDTTAVSTTSGTMTASNSCGRYSEK